MTDYSKSVIYKICSKDINITEVYIGYTTNYKIRYNCHKSWCNNINGSKYNLKIYKFIREHGGWENWEMEELYKYPCETKKEISAEERRAYDRFNSSLNTFKPNRSNEEWRNDNPNWKKEFYQDNKKEILAEQAERKKCECGLTYAHSKRKRHTDTPRHIKRIEDLFEVRTILTDYFNSV